MIKHNLTPNVITSRVLNSTAAGTSNVNTSWVDTQGAETVRFIALIGTLTATQVTGMKLQYSDDGSTSLGDASPSAIGPMLDTQSNALLIAEITHPTHRYVRGVITRGTANAVIDGVIAEVAIINRVPVTQDTTVAFSEVNQDSPIGTA